MKKFHVARNPSKAPFVSLNGNLSRLRLGTGRFTINPALLSLSLIRTSKSSVGYRIGFFFCFKAFSAASRSASSLLASSAAAVASALACAIAAAFASASRFFSSAFAAFSAAGRLSRVQVNHRAWQDEFYTGSTFLFPLPCLLHLLCRSSLFLGL